MAATFTPIAPRPAPVRTTGAAAWARANLFGNWMSTAATLLMVLLAFWLVPPFLGWAVMNAVVRPDADACQAARGVGACWGVITEKWRFIIFGRYPFESQWRPEVATILLLGLLVVSCIRAF